MNLNFSFVLALFNLHNDRIFNRLDNNYLAYCMPIAKGQFLQKETKKVKLRG